MPCVDCLWEPEKVIFLREGKERDTCMHGIDWSWTSFQADAMQRVKHRVGAPSRSKYIVYTSMLPDPQTADMQWSIGKHYSPFCMHLTHPSLSASKYSWQLHTIKSMYEAQSRVCNSIRKYVSAWVCSPTHLATCKQYTGMQCNSLHKYASQ